jgi:hypothetical protein
LTEKETTKKLDVMTELQQAMDRVRAADSLARTLEAKIQVFLLPYLFCCILIQ